MPSLALPPPGWRRRRKLDPVLLGVLAGVSALALLLSQPVATAAGSPVSPTPSGDFAGDAPIPGNQSTAVPDQWARGISLDLERLRPGPTSTPAKAGAGASAGPAQPGQPSEQSSQGAGGPNPGALPSSVTTLGAKVPAAVRRFEASVLKWSIHHRVDPNLIAALIMTESEGNPNAVSSAGAIGLMQVMGGSFDPDENIRAGTGQFAEYLGRFGQIELALAAYNAGPNAVTRYGGVPPYQETRDHIFRVLLRYRLYSTP